MIRASYYKLILLITFGYFFLLTSWISAQSNHTNGGVWVDENGVMRWEKDSSEIKGFGVNYTVPFAHAYRSAKKLGKDPLREIDRDVYHFARLGLDLYRVHVWDTEISDTLGNLLYNEHLHAFDYLLHKLKERNIRFVLTPIAFWGNGWPEPDENTPGFSRKYGKGNCLTDPDAIKAQENYLFQFMNHVNPYTGIAYKDDPDLIAVEVSNEPHHREAPEKVTEFIKRMVAAIRKSGYQKPVFYNISHSVHLAENYFQAGIQGGTFQWYPTGLGYQQELPGNALPKVDQYKIPFEETIKKHYGAKLVYEFDAADVGKAYVYPAMARSFRQAGIQIATHFSYDPMFLAYANTEYNTHYMNLAYTPQKALGLMMCAEVFREIPMYKDFGAYPQNTTFGDFSVSYEKDLAEYNSGEKFYYSNSTQTTPKSESELTHIAGYGSSSLVQYHGTGAYFLDKLANGVWRLEVMPDVLTVRNPYGRNSLDKEVSVIQWNLRKMEVNLDNLGKNFAIQAVNEGNSFTTEVDKGKFSIRPGVYVLTKTGVQFQSVRNTRINHFYLQEFEAPKPSVTKTWLVHTPAEIAFANQPLMIEAQVVSDKSVESVEVWSGRRRIELENTTGFTYAGQIPKDWVEKGTFDYYLILRGKDGVETFPAGEEGLPYEWDFYNRQTYSVRVIDHTHPVYLFHAQDDYPKISRTRWTQGIGLVPLDDPNESELQINLEELHRTDPENLNGPVIYDYSIKNYLNHRLEQIGPYLDGKKTLVFTGRALTPDTRFVQIALITKDGFAYGKTIRISSEMKSYEIPVKDLTQIPTVNLPRPYPTFLPYYFETKTNHSLDLTQVEGMQISVGPGIPAGKLTQNQGIGVKSLVLK